MVKTRQKLSIYNEEDTNNLKQLSEKITKERAINLIYELSRLENDMKLSTQRLIVFQAGLIKLCNKELENNLTVNNSNNSGSNGEIYARLEKIENYLRSGGRSR